MVTLATGALGNAANRQVIAFGRAAGEDDFLLAGTKRMGDRLARLVNGLLGVPALGMADACRVAEIFGEKWKHRLDHPGVDGCRGMMVHVDDRVVARHAFEPPTYPKRAWSEICDQVSN